MRINYPPTSYMSSSWFQGRGVSFGGSTYPRVAGCIAAASSCSSLDARCSGEASERVCIAITRSGFASNIACIRLIANTTAAENDESNEVYITKLALTMGRSGYSMLTPHGISSNIILPAILRPRQENEISIQDRHPTCEYRSRLTLSSNADLNCSALH